MKVWLNSHFQLILSQNCPDSFNPSIITSSVLAQSYTVSGNTIANASCPNITQPSHQGTEPLELSQYNELNQTSSSPNSGTLHSVTEGNLISVYLVNRFVLSNRPSLLIALKPWLTCPPLLENLQCCTAIMSAENELKFYNYDLFSHN